MQFRRKLYDVHNEHLNTNLYIFLFNGSELFVTFERICYIYVTKQVYIPYQTMIEITIYPSKLTF